mgnify:CR=1 FL=1
MTSHDLLPAWSAAFADAGWYEFAPLAEGKGLRLVDIEVFGGLTQDIAMGGINIEAVKRAADMKGGYARIVWLRAENVRWRQICIRAGCVRSTAWRRWAAALLTISRKLNSQAKSAAKVRSAKPPTETTGDRPREGRANTQDNPQDALNFGRDSCNTSGAQKA